MATTSSTAASREHGGVGERVDLGVDADLEEEHRDEEVADRCELAPDAVGLVGSCRGRCRRRRHRRSAPARRRRRARRRPSVNARASATIVPAEREMRSMSVEQRGREPHADEPPERRGRRPRRRGSRRPTATSTEPSVTSRTTTVRTTRPITSSATAAPSTMRASVVARARRSPKTRAVMPTLVAVSAAPTKSDVVEVEAEQLAWRPMPSTNGATTPTVATCSEARPTLPSSRRSISRPTSSRAGSRRARRASRSTSSSAPTRPSSDGPMRMPATISPTTAGTPMRSAISAASLAATRTTRMSRRTWAMSMRSWSGPCQCGQATDAHRAGTAGRARPGVIGGRRRSAGSGSWIAPPARADERPVLHLRIGLPRWRTRTRGRRAHPSPAGRCRRARPRASADAALHDRVLDLEEGEGDAEDHGPDHERRRWPARGTARAVPP